MARILLLYPNRWGRGITAVWIPSHTAVLRARGHEVRLCDCTFYKDWTFNETRFNTANMQYKLSDYEQRIVFSDQPVVQALAQEIESFDPDVIFWGAVSSHIHGEGEYVALEYGHTLLSRLNEFRKRSLTNFRSSIFSFAANPRTSLPRLSRFLIIPHV